MKVYRVLLLAVLAVAVVLAGCIRKVERNTTPSGRPDPELDSIMRLYADSGYFSGTVLIAVGDSVKYRQSFGYANVELEVPFTDTTRFKIHSMSKPMTSAVVLSLVEAGTMSLDSSITTYLPQLPKSWRGVRIRHLLTHMSGIPEFTGMWLDNWSGSMRTTLDFLEDSLKKLPLESTPEQKWSYSNIGYVLLAAAAEGVTGVSFDQVLAEKVFLPCAMHHAGLEQSPPWHEAQYDGSMVVPYLATGYNGGPEWRQEAFSKMYVIPGAGGIYANADDILHFMRQLFDRELIGPALRDEMLAASESNDVSYGFGWFVTDRNGRTVYRHDGGNNGFVTSMEYYPESKVSVIVLSNYGFAPIGGIRAALADGAFRLASGEE